MIQSKAGIEGRRTTRRQFGIVLLCLLVCLGFLFWDGLRPDHTVFSNDGSLGKLHALCEATPAGFLGYWQDLNWLGNTGPSASPDITNGLALFCVKGLAWLGGVVVFSKIYAPFALMFLGLSAWLCFRQWKLSPPACLLGALAAALNSDFFSTACWGVASQPMSFGLDFLALAALADETSPRRWLRVALAGFAVGMGVMEAFDIGAVFSIVVAGFIACQALAGEGTTSQRLVRGVTRLALVTVCAAFIAASAIIGLVSTQIKGVANMGQDPESKARRWAEATQWSLPKCEALSLVVPGLFGYRMDTPMGLPEGLQDHYRGGNYWGACGRDPAWDTYFASGKQGERPTGFIRYGGGGSYCGVIVVLLAVWTLFQGYRKEDSVFRVAERRLIWFWSSVALICVLVGFGRFAPFYQLFYALPFASTMRNPCKFFHVVVWILVILFAYGVHGLSRKCLEPQGGVLRGLQSQLQTWWAKAAAFDRNWVRGSAAALAASLVAWIIYSASRDRLAAYLQEVDFDSALAGAIAGFSVRQVGWFILFLTLSLGLVIVILSGYFSGRRARVGGVLLGLLLVADLGRANVPWVITWNWVQKYATNPVIDFLRQKPYEHLVAVLPFDPPPQFKPFSDLYDIEWKQQLFQYYNIQSLDVVMNPRAQVDYLAFENALFFDRTTNTLHRVTRRWQLTNTRYLLGAAPYLDVLNQQIDPVQQRFRFAIRFDITAKPGITNLTSLGLDEVTAVIRPDGQYAVFDFTGALPRAKLYTNWQVSTNDETTLKELASREFDPEQMVLVADSSIPKPQSPSTLNPQPLTNSVQFVTYAPKHIVLRAQAGCPAVLLLNDHFNSNWKVSVDGKPEKLLRCNYLMRGVQVAPGQHVIEFDFAPPIGTLYVSLTAVVLGLMLCGILALHSRRQAATQG